MAAEWPLVLFSLLAGCGGCAFAYVGASELTGTGAAARFKITLVAFIVTVIGGFCSVAHLASPQNVMAAVWNLGSFSGISLELIAIGVTCVVMFAYLICVWREAGEMACKVLGVLGIVCGLVLAFVTGHGYVIESQSAWNTEMLPVAYLGTSLAMGAFLYATCAVAWKVELKRMGMLVGIGAILGALSQIAYAAAVGFDRGASEPVLLWGGMMVCGVVIVAVCGIAMMMGKKVANPLVVPCVGLVAALIGGIAVRVFMWAMGTGFLNLFTVASGVREIFF